MKALHIFIAFFLAAALNVSAQGPAKRTMPKRTKTEATDTKDEGVKAPERLATPPAAAKPEGQAKPAPAAPAKPAPSAAPSNRPGSPATRGGRPGSGNQATPPAGGSYREFPTAATMPDDAAWRREVYRTLDLTREENAVLYFPIMPTAERQNLFCYLFRLILKKSIAAYEYTLDTNEHFDAGHQISGKKIMDTHNIYYEEVTGENGKKSIRVNDADLPSEDVKLYFVKECVYYDQHSASFRTKITAICPVMVGGYNDFGEDESTRIPLFWVKYEDAAPYLAKLSLMGSSMNNAAMISADDYFTMGRYKGDIYKTTNLQDKILIQSDGTEEEIRAERQRIEGQLTGFQQHVWGHDTDTRLLDVYGNPVLDGEGKVIRYNEQGQLVDGKGRRIAFLAHDKDSVNIISDNPELEPLPEIVLLNERGFAVDEQGNPLLKDNGTPIDITDEYPDPARTEDDSKKKAPARSTSAAPTRRTTTTTPTRRTTATTTASKSSSSKPAAKTSATTSKTSTSKPAASKSAPKTSAAKSKPAKSAAPKSKSPKASSGGGMTVRRERH